MGTGAPSWAVGGAGPGSGDLTEQGSEQDKTGSVTKPCANSSPSFLLLVSRLGGQEPWPVAGSLGRLNQTQFRLPSRKMGALGFFPPRMQRELAEFPTIRASSSSP